MLCSDLRAQLLAPDGPLSPEAASHVASCATCSRLAAASERLDGLLASSVVAPPPAALQERLAGLVGAAEPARSPEVSGALAQMGWRERLAGGFRRLVPSPWVAVGEVAGLFVLVYALVQLLGWIVGSTSLVLGDVPYAIELLVLSPALDYAAQFQAVLQQLALWLVVAGVGWMVAQGLPWRSRNPAGS